MAMFKEITGNLVELALEKEFDVIAQGCNCFCRMRSGIAKAIVDKFPAAERVDNETIAGDIRKLGNYTIGTHFKYKKPVVKIINCYTQYRYDRDKQVADYDAITLCMRKINHQFKGQSIGLPLIGCGLAGGNWDIVKEIFKKELTDLDVTIVHFKE